MVEAQDSDAFPFALIPIDLYFVRARLLNPTAVMDDYLLEKRNGGTMHRIAVAVVILGVFCIQCEMGMEPMVPSPGTLVGTWLDLGYAEDARVLGRSPALGDDRGGFTFRSDYTLVERKNAGWCGTPPISYADFEGTWTVDDQNRLHIIVGYWGGLDTVDYRILSCTADSLRLQWLPQDEEQMRPVQNFDTDPE